MKLVTISKQFRVRDCFDCSFSIYCNSQPVIESSAGIVFSNLSPVVGYPQLLAQFKTACMDVWTNHWSEIHDFTKKAGEVHFKLQFLPEFEIEFKRALQ